MYGQMTAGSWIYIGTQGILQGTYETFAAVAASTSAAPWPGTIVADRRARRHGRRAAARRHHQRRRRAVRRGRPDPGRSAGSTTATSTRSPTRSTTASRGCRPRPRAPAAVGRPSSATPPTSSPSWSAAASCPTSSPTRPAPTTPLHGYVPNGMTFEEAAELRRPSPSEYVERAQHSMAAHCRGDARLAERGRGRLRLRQRRSAARRRTPASRTPSTIPGSCPPTSGRCSARATARSGGPACPATRPTSPPPTTPCSTAVPRRRPAAALGPVRPREGERSRACRRGSAGSGTASGTWPVWPSTTWSRAAIVTAPIAIGRDHLDSGSVASPYRETEACATAPTRSPTGRCSTRCSTPRRAPAGCRSTTAAASASGKSIHAGQVVVADGTDLSRREGGAGAHERPGHGRDPSRRRRLRHRARHRARRRRPDAARARDARAGLAGVSDLVVRRIGRLTTWAQPRLSDAAVVIRDGRVVWVGADRDLPAGLGESAELDAGGCGGAAGLRRLPHPLGLGRQPPRRRRRPLAGESYQPAGIALDGRRPPAPRGTTSC